MPEILLIVTFLLLSLWLNKEFHCVYFYITQSQYRLTDTTVP